MSCFMKFCSLFLMFSHRIHSEKLLQSITMKPKWFPPFSSFHYIIFNGILKLIFNIRNTSLYFIIIFFSNHNFTSIHILIINYFLNESTFGHDFEFLKNYSCVLSDGLFWYKQQTITFLNPALIYLSFPLSWVRESLYNKPLLANH